MVIKRSVFSRVIYVLPSRQNRQKSSLKECVFISNNTPNEIIYLWCKNCLKLYINYFKNIKYLLSGIGFEPGYHPVYESVNHHFLYISFHHTAFFIRPFYKMMLGKKITLTDLESVVSMLYYLHRDNSFFLYTNHISAICTKHILDLGNLILTCESY